MNVSRRFALRSAAAILPVAVLAACGFETTTTTNGVTTITINVAKIDSWAQALVNGASLVASLPGVSALPDASLIAAVGTVISNDLTAFNTATGGQVSLTFNGTSIPAAVQSLLSDGQTLLADAQKVISTSASTVVTTAQSYLDALQTIVSLFEAAVSLVSGAVQLPMTEAQALAVLHR